jgi:hypothetical protein
MNDTANPPTIAPPTTAIDAPSAPAIPASPTLASSTSTNSSLVIRALDVLKREPILFVTLTYVLISFIGIWANYWFYRRFDLPILEYMQGSDYLVAGLREPAYLWMFAAALLFAWLVTWPERWRRRHPERAEALRRHWWGRVFLPGKSLWWTWGSMAPETGLVFGTFWVMIWLLYALVLGKANAIHGGEGQPLRLTLAGATQPLAGEARLLGTSSAFIFLYWPEGRRAEALPIESVARIESMRAAMAPLVPKPAPAPTASTPAKR